MRQYSTKIGIKLDVDTQELDWAITKAEYLAKAIKKVSLRSALKMRLAGIVAPRRKITMEELIERDHGNNR